MHTAGSSGPMARDRVNAGHGTLRIPFRELSLLSESVFLPEQAISTRGMHGTTTVSLW